jgi:tRNA dimethylallyltransferase
VHGAERAIRDVASRGRTPLVVGGTGLYLRGLLRGIVEAPARDPELRERLYAVARRRGARALHRLLQRLDPESAGRIASGDTQRLVRAIELAGSGAPTWSERLRDEGTWAAGRERFEALKIGLDMDRERLNRRLDQRVVRFFDAGLVDEVRRLLDTGVPPEANAFKAIGYREVLRALESGDDPRQVLEEVQRSTRRYSKRQRTWFRGEPGVVWLDAAEERGRLVDGIVERWRRFTTGA